MIDFVLNGKAHGDVANALAAVDGDVSILRPYVGDDGNSYITVLNDSGEPEALVTNTPATLRKDDWQLLDDAIIRVAKPRLQAVGDLRSRGLEFNIPNGMAKTVFQTQTVSDIEPADVDMDGIRATTGDRPHFELTNLPLPIIHKNFSFSARQVMTSRNSSTPIDTTSAELAGRRVAEEAEKMLLGISSIADQFAYGGGTIYGYTDHPSRLTKAMTIATDTAWTPGTTVQEVLAMKRQSQDAGHYGPWKLYCSSDWDIYLDDDYSTQKGSNTLRQRLAAISGIESVETLDYLSANTMLLVQMTSDVVREVIGMELTTLQWQSMGGLQLNFKVMAIMVPQLRADFNDQMGLVHGTAS